MYKSLAINVNHTSINVNGDWNKQEEAYHGFVSSLVHTRPQHIHDNTFDSTFWEHVVRSIHLALVESAADRIPNGMYPRTQWHRAQQELRSSSSNNITRLQ